MESARITVVVLNKRYPAIWECAAAALALMDVTTVDVAAPSDIGCYPCKSTVARLKAQDMGGGGNGAAIGRRCRLPHPALHPFPRTALPLPSPFRPRSASSVFAQPGLSFCHSRCIPQERWFNKHTEQVRDALSVAKGALLGFKATFKAGPHRVWRRQIKVAHPPHPGAAFIVDCICNCHEDLDDTRRVYIPQSSLRLWKRPNESPTARGGRG